ncbi:hypothetical protein BAUCODRAFT_570143 [Baudoinia panamericana UAMH 10762]|uniref:Uncharacterized protein n=1 Tax=Baudoinia panamericana (strain UAMH 10762) TaxID=717646 RepID=M2MY48_BAUPA|nr:uncharacterized protein BAUCODRAFT_570143 [Baudoinia panamericana UAMH 10762]EMC91579.1 hypothetical protein BAUCODRAFT_570143 [Baudoinia panamericana UAMH 10762]
MGYPQLLASSVLPTAVLILRALPSIVTRRASINTKSVEGQAMGSITSTLKPPSRPRGACRLLKLPCELRLRIYRYVFADNTVSVTFSLDHPAWPESACGAPGIFPANKQAFEEATDIYYDLTAFMVQSGSQRFNQFDQAFYMPRNLQMLKNVRYDTYADLEEEPSRDRWRLRGTAATLRVSLKAKDDQKVWFAMPIQTWDRLADAAWNTAALQGDALGEERDVPEQMEWFEHVRDKAELVKRHMRVQQVLVQKRLGRG